jgi:hypothetical protein
MKWFRALLLGLLTTLIGLIAGYVAVVRPRLRAWGIDKSEAALKLPGDALVPDATSAETRGISIAAPPDAIWPWLVQMGYGRAGWYSYDALDNDNPSAKELLTTLPELRVGDVMPTHPGGGFEVKVLEPNNALVLYSDTALVQSQAEHAQAAGTDQLPTNGLKVSGGLLSASFPDFAASWAFYHEPKDDGTTRLMERFRARSPGEGVAAALIGEVMGTGILLMTRKQMLGIKERVEREPGRPVDAVGRVPSPMAVPDPA